MDLFKLLEIASTLVGLIYIACSILGRKELFIFGLLGALLSIPVLYHASFYGDMLLQIYYVVVSIYGLYYWIKGGKRDSNGEDLPIKRSTGRDWILVLAGTATTWVLFYFGWLRFTGDAYPIADACTNALCIVGTWMLARKMLDNWHLFILADALTCVMYCIKGIYFFAGLNGIYTILAIVGYFKWKRLLS